MALHSTSVLVGTCRAALHLDFDTLSATMLNMLTFSSISRRVAALKRIPDAGCRAGPSQAETTRTSTKAAVAGAMTLVGAYRKRRGWSQDVPHFSTRLDHRLRFGGIRTSENVRDHRGTQ